MEDEPETREAFQLMLERTADMYGKGKPEPSLLRTYFEALKRFSLDDIRQGLSRHIGDPDQGQFMPKPADIIRNIDGNTQTQAELAWTKVDQAIRRVGPWQTVVFDDPIIHAVIADMGGWVHLCNVKTEEYPFRHNEFSKRYRGYSGRDVVQAARKLIGITESENQQRNMAHTQAPVLIGDISKAKLLLETGLDSTPNIVHTANDLVAGAAKQITGGDDG